MKFITEEFVSYIGKTPVKLERLVDERGRVLRYTYLGRYAGTDRKGKQNFLRKHGFGF